MKELNNITTLLFDLGGVLIELGALEDVIPSEQNQNTPAFERWRHCRYVHLYESGQCTTEQFADGVVSELQLSISADEFLRRFGQWPQRMFEGSTELLDSLSGHFQLACLSNTNAHHFETFIDQQPAMSRFEHRFFSFQMGLMKPRQPIYLETIARLGVQPESVLFFDDSEANVEAARKAGMHSRQVYAPDGVLKALNSLSLMP